MCRIKKDISIFSWNPNTLKYLFNYQSSRRRRIGPLRRPMSTLNVETYQQALKLYYLMIYWVLIL